MSRGFGATHGVGATDAITIPQYAAINDLVTLSLALWTYRASNGGGSGGRLLDKAPTTTAGSDGWNWFVADPNYRFGFFRWTTTIGAWTIAMPALNEWHHILLTYDAGATTNDPIVYVDGASVTVTEVSTPAGTLGAETDDLIIGNRADAARNWDGRHAEAAVWNRVLSAGEAAAIGKGYSPLFCPRGLVAYPELVRTVRNRMNNTALTVTGTAVQPHPRIIYPAPPLGVYRTPAPAGGLSIPVAMAYYRRLRAA